MKKILVLFFIFSFSFLIRLWNLNEMGRTWDEIAYVDPGHKYLHLIKNLDFNNEIWIHYVDALPLPRYLYGIGGIFDVVKFNLSSVSEYHYNLYHSRLISVFFSSLTVVLVSLIGIRYISKQVGILSGIILAMLPIFVGLSQVVTIESIQFFFFTLSMYYFLNLFERPTKIRYLLSGIVLGLSLHAKYTNVLLVPIFIILYVYWYLETYYNVSLLKLFNIQLSKILPTIKEIYNRVSKKKYTFFHSGLITMVFTTIVVFILLWPMPYFHINDVLKNIYDQRFAINVRPPPELFFGKFMEVPIFYYLVYFFTTTPFIVLIIFLFGLLKIRKEKKIIYFTLIVWFFIPFIQSFYNFRQNGIRYIIEIYAPLSLLSALGLQYITEKISGKAKAFLITSLLLITYLSFTLKVYTPYYLSYFNEIVGGVRNVYEKKMFPIGWWGEGMKEVSDYMVTNIPKGSVVALQLNPMHTFNKIDGFRYATYNKKGQYDYVIVNYFSEIRQFFDTKELIGQYKKLHDVTVNGIPIVTIYKHR